MTLRALKFIAGGGTTRFARTELGSGIDDGLQNLKAKSTPAAYVVPDQNLEILRELKDAVVDRGRKGPAKELSKLLLGHSRIPIISGSYTVSGRLVQGIESLLEKAARRDDRNIYIIGTSEKLFNKLWNEAGDQKQPASKRRTSGSAEPTDLSTEDLLGLLPQQYVPEELVRTFIGESLEAQLVRQLIMRAAGHSRPVLILGDTGTGKEVVARSIHKYSLRSSEKFVPVNCASIPRELLESELFGIKKDVASNVGERTGLWEQTGKGTLVLDEIGDLTPDHQAKILRALQENKIRRIGEVAERNVHARIIAATNRDLFWMMQGGQFREDLYYRLRIFLIRTPALRNHPQDIPLLVHSLWRRITSNPNSKLPEGIVAKLQTYRWPGNVRELKAVLMGIHSLFGEDNLGIEHLNAVFQLQGQSPAAGEAPKGRNEFTLHSVECLRHLRKVAEVVRACKVTMRPIVEDKKIDAATVESVQGLLHHRLSELEVLCLHPLLFHSEVTFSFVNRLKGKLFHFHSLLHSEPPGALSYWKNEVSEEYKLVLSTVFREVERLTDRPS